MTLQGLCCWMGVLLDGSTGRDMPQGHRHFGLQINKGQCLSGLRYGTVFLVASWIGPEPFQYCRLLEEPSVQGLYTEYTLAHPGLSQIQRLSESEGILETI